MNALPPTARESLDKFNEKYDQNNWWRHKIQADVFVVHPQKLEGFSIFDDTAVVDTVSEVISVVRHCHPPTHAFVRDLKKMDAQGVANWYSKISTCLCRLKVEHSELSKDKTLIACQIENDQNLLNLVTKVLEPLLLEIIKTP